LRFFIDFLWGLLVNMFTNYEYVNKLEELRTFVVQKILLVLYLDEALNP